MLKAKCSALGALFLLVGLMLTCFNDSFHCSECR